jgi:asparagine synthase (glutamine-hydrolysing)
MAGLCGVLGDGGRLPAETEERVSWTGEETTSSYADEHVELTLSNHSLLADNSSYADDTRDVLVWIWGDIYGRETAKGYSSWTAPRDRIANRCARLYEEKGMDFASSLNGDFALAVYDRSVNTFWFATDRVGTHPVFYTNPTGDAIVFASTLQALAHHPDVRPEFDLDYLLEYLQLRRVFGVETPLDGVRELPPGSVVEVDLDDLTTDSTTYWRPKHDPIDKPSSYFVDRIADTLRQIFTEWTRDDLDYGLLLSGGSDSRLIEACIDQPVVAFHTAAWMSKEARTARRVAETSGDEFRLLARDADYEERLLETTPQLSDFSGWFDQAYFLPFEDEIRTEVDVLVSGLFGDMLFSQGALTTRQQSLGPIGTLSLPFKQPIDDVDDYIDAKLERNEPLPYVTSDRSVRDVLAENVQWTDDGIVSHGVRYDSLLDLELYGDYYPLGADTEAIFPRSLAQICPYRTPFLDNRLLDIQQRIPRKYLLRRDLISAALRQVAPALAEIPHARTGVPLKYPFPIQYVGGNLNGLWKRHVYEEPAPAPHLDHKPWPDRSALLRTKPFGIDALNKNEKLIRELPFLDYEAVERTIQSQFAGETNHTTLYSLLTLIDMPVTEMVRRSVKNEPLTGVSVPFEDGDH